MTRHAIGLIAVVLLVSILSVNLWPGAAAQPADAALFGNKFVLMRFKSSSERNTYLENVTLKKIDGRTFLYGTGADVPEQQWQKGRAVWAAFDDVSEVTAFPTLAALRKAAEDQ